jgi:hypothetical protein
VPAAARTAVTERAKTARNAVMRARETVIEIVPFRSG